MTPDEVADAVFGVETRDTPVPKWLGSGTLPRNWSMFFDGPKPDHYVEPHEDVKEPLEVPMGWWWRRPIFG